MRRKVLLLLFILNVGYLVAQELKIGVSYEYLYSGQWDKAVQTYNFSRPFQAEKQPLIKNGLNSSVSYVFKNEKHLKHGLNVSYAYFQSSSENNNFKNSLRLHFVNIGYLLHYSNPEKWKGLYTDFVISASSSGLFRRVNSVSFVYDESKSKAFGIGGEVHLKVGYSFKLKKRSYLSAFISGAYTPYFYTPKSEAIINQTKGLTSKTWTGILRAQIGLMYHLKWSGLKK